jgi:hypothetical protein
VTNLRGSRCHALLIYPNAPDFIPLFIVVISPNHRSKAIYYLPADLQVPQMFKQRKALSKSAKRAGWVGCNLVFGDDGAIKPVRIQ